MSLEVTRQCFENFVFVNSGKRANSAEPTRLRVSYHNLKTCWR